ncbi:DUF3052 family protein [bacterium]|nr:MAG: DUF3052 family protein [bacterium]
MKSSGYSGTPLAKKLGIKTSTSLKLLNQPDYYFDLFCDFPSNVALNQADLFDTIHLFVTQENELRTELATIRQMLKQNGAIWISWPKKTSKKQSNLDGNLVREIGLQTGLVDIKVCAVDDTWSGLKFVIPVKDRK